MALDRFDGRARPLGDGPDVRNDDDGSPDLDCLGDDLWLLNRWLVGRLVGRWVGVTPCEVSVVGLADDTVRGEPAATDVLGTEDDDIALMDRASHLHRDRDEAVTRVERRLHAPGGDEAQQDRLAEELTDDEREEEEEGEQLARSDDPSQSTHANRRAKVNGVFMMRPFVRRGRLATTGPIPRLTVCVFRAKYLF
jgi:hypothetical protein